MSEKRGESSGPASLTLKNSSRPWTMSNWSALKSKGFVRSAARKVTLGGRALGKHEFDGVQLEVTLVTQTEVSLPDLRLVFLTLEMLQPHLQPYTRLLASLSADKLQGESPCTATCTRTLNYIRLWYAGDGEIDVPHLENGFRWVGFKRDTDELSTIMRLQSIMKEVQSGNVNR